MSFEYNDPILTKRRAGTDDDPYIDISESVLVVNSKALLKEIPDRFHKVKVTGDAVEWVEKSSGELDENQFTIDYVSNIVTFHSSRNGLQLNFQYKGTGLHYIPSTMVYTEQNDGEVVKTLKGDIDEIYETLDNEVENVQELNSGIAKEEDNRVTAEEIRERQEQERQTNTAEAIVNTEAATNSANSAATTTKLNYLNPVDSFADIAITYPSPSLGDVVQVKDTNDWYRYNGSEWINIHSLNLTGYATTNALSTIDHAKAEIVRNSIHSGFLNLSELDLSEPNKIKILQDTVVNVNGYLNTISAGTIIDLPPAPTEGIREDLVFFETYFPIEGNGYEMSWRFRSVAGVDFETYSEGIFDHNIINYSEKNELVKPQGGNSEPISPNNAMYMFFGESIYNNPHATTHHDSEYFLHFNDLGMFIAGNGSDTSKDALLTADGYVYAIPMFRIKRRNSGGYSVENTNGAREYYVLDYTFSPTLNDNEVRQISIAELDYGKVVVGDTWYSNDTTWGFKVLSKDGTNKITIEHFGSSGVTDARGYIYTSDRPDNLFSNIIDQRDVIDLRHKVSLTSVDYNKVMQEEFNRLLEGKNGNVDMKKEYFGLEKAPSYVEPELQAVKVLGNDGITRELVNLIGVHGDISKNGIDGWINNGSRSILTLEDDLIKVEINDDITATAYHASYVVNENSYYLVIAQIKNGTATSTKLYVDGDVVSGDYRSSALVTDSQFKYSYVKLEPDSFKSDATRINPHVYINGIDGEYGYGKDFAVYEINKETYDKIDVDPEFTGEELVKKLPYVNNYPNIVENLLKDPLFNNVDTLSSDFRNYNATDYDIVNDIFYITNTKSQQLKATNTGNTGYNPMNKGTYLVLKHIEGIIYTFSFYGKGWEDKKSIDYYNNDNLSIISSNKKSLENGWIKYSITFSIQGSDARLYIRPNGNNTYDFTAYINAPSLSISEQPNPVFVPHGKWYVPYDYANGEINTRFDLTDQKRILSDAQTSQKVSDKIEVLSNGHLPHIEVAQSVEGEWISGDTIKINGYDGIVSGVIDEDTALTKIISYADGQTHKDLTVDSTKFTVTDVSKLSIGDTYNLWQPDYEIDYSLTITVIDIDVDNNIVSTDVEYNSSDISTYWIVETTADTSTPKVKADGIIGTWTNLATSEATYTIDTPPSDNTADILIEYSINYAGGNGIEHVPTEVLEGEVNKQKLVKSDEGIVTIKANFEGKYGGDTDLNPHITKAVGNGEHLYSPDEFTHEITDINYREISKHDNISYDSATEINLNQTQHIFSFNIIRAITDKLGEGFFEGCVTIEDKVQRLKDRIYRIACNWWGYGWSPSGNKAILSGWRNDDNSWYFYEPATHTNSAVTKIDFTVNMNNHPQYIDDNGFAHYLTYTDPAVDVKTSLLFPIDDTIETGEERTYIISENIRDYVKIGDYLSHTESGENLWKVVDVNGIQFTLERINDTARVTAGQEAIYDFKVKSTIYTDYVELEIQVDVSETGYDVHVPENEFPVMTENLLTTNQAFPVDVKGFYIYDNSSYVDAVDKGVIEISYKSDGNDNAIIGFLNYIDNPPLNEYVTYSAVIEALYDEEFRYSVNLYDNIAGSTETQTTMKKGEKRRIYVTKKFDKNSTANYFYCWALNKEHIDIPDRTPMLRCSNFKIEKGINPNPTWTPGRKSKPTLNYLGKVVGDDISVPHKAYNLEATDITTLTPSDFVTELTDYNYNSLSKMDGNLLSNYVTNDNSYRANLFEFDLSHLGLSLSELKEVIRKLTVSWTGYGQGDDGSGGLAYGVKIMYWRNDISSWFEYSGGSNNSSVPSTTISSLGDGSSVNVTTNNQKVYILVHSTHPAGVNSDSIVYTDYIKLDVELSEEIDYVKSNVIKVRKETKEIKLEYLIRDYRTGITDSVALWYDHVPYQGLETKEGKILTLSNDLVVTTRGTGDIHHREYTDSESKIKILSPILPKGTDVFDYLLLNEKVELKNHSSYGNADMPFIHIPIINSWLNSQSATIGSINSSLPAFIGQDLAYPIPHLTIIFGLVVINEEIYLRVRTRYGNDAICISGGSSHNSEEADYKITGNPLIKEV
ncbi:hypothetical protein [Chengkuizengella marina]|uniref:Uncharacterized protein n=1 Tax=Chengkuizengella marina TaxID=2507566 RepID=A0A6N9PYI7_9BACL|nr:hypothetical protein [Chengkuizengella marina]NBI28579.1 hypothetical protein [Chengkuizengella marina]